MSKRQAVVLWTSISIFALIGLFPPWVQTVQGREIRIQRPLPHRFIMSPPASANLSGGISLDIARLTVEWLTVAVVAVGIGVSIERFKWSALGCDRNALLAAAFALIVVLFVIGLWISGLRFGREPEANRGGKTVPIGATVPIEKVRPPTQ